MSVESPQNPAEARLAIAESLVDMLVDLSDDQIDMPADELALMQESMADVADILLEGLELQVLEIAADGSLVCSITLPPVVAPPA